MKEHVVIEKLNQPFSYFIDKIKQVMVPTNFNNCLHVRGCVGLGGWLRVSGVFSLMYVCIDV